VCVRVCECLRMFTHTHTHTHTTGKPDAQESEPGADGLGARAPRGGGGRCSRLPLQAGFFISKIK
jgi:hypothetical protein